MRDQAPDQPGDRVRLGADAKLQLLWREAVNDLGTISRILPKASTSNLALVMAARVRGRDFLQVAAGSSD